MAQKPLIIGTDGNVTEVNGVITSAGAANAGQIVVTNPSGQIDVTLIPGSDVITAMASENIAAGALINIAAGGVRNADNTTIGKQAHGFAPAAILSGASGQIVEDAGIISGLTGLTAGTEYFLGTAGAVTTTIPTATNSIIQKVGVARTTTELDFMIKVPIIRA